MTPGKVLIIVAALSSEHQATMTALWVKLDEAVSTTLAKNCPCCSKKKLPRLRKKLCKITYKVGHYTQQLSGGHLWPCGQREDLLDIGTIRGIISKVPDWEDPSCSRGVFCDTSVQIDLKEKLEKIVDTFVEARNGLCLKCAKVGCYEGTNNCGLSPSVACAGLGTT